MESPTDKFAIFIVKYGPRIIMEQLVHKVLTQIEYEALRDFVPFAQFKKRDKHTWRSVNFSKVAGFVTNRAIHHI